MSKLGEGVGGNLPRRFLLLEDVGSEELREGWLMHGLRFVYSCVHNGKWWLALCQNRMKVESNQTCMGLVSPNVHRS